MKQNAGAHNAELIASLLRMMTNFTSNLKVYEKTLQYPRDSVNTPKVLQPEEVIALVATLYQLPINGQQFHQQVEGIIINQEKHCAQREIYVDLPPKAASSKIMLQFKGFMSST
jgi:hypothetical protein